MGFYLNSASPASLYKSETESLYFVDKTELLKELFPLIEQGNRHIWGIIGDVVHGSLEPCTDMPPVK